MEQLIRDGLEGEFIAGVEIIEKEIESLLSEGEAILAEFE